MKKINLVLLLLLVPLSACTTVKGSDGRDYPWIKPIPFNSPNVVPPNSPGVNVYQGTINGRGYTATVFK